MLVFDWKVLLLLSDGTLVTKGFGAALGRKQHQQLTSISAGVAGWLGNRFVPHFLGVG